MTCWFYWWARRTWLERRQGYSRFCWSDHGERGVKGEKSIQGDNSNVLSVLADHLPIQLATRYGEKNVLCQVPCIRG